MRRSSPRLLHRSFSRQGASGQGRGLRSCLPGRGRRAPAPRHTLRLLPILKKIQFGLHHALLWRREQPRLLPPRRRLLLRHQRQVGPEVARRDLHGGQLGTECGQQLPQEIPPQRIILLQLSEHEDGRQGNARLHQAGELQDPMEPSPGPEGQSLQPTLGERQLRHVEL